MPAHWRAARRQDAVLWEATGDHGNDGTPIVSGAVEVKVRWTEGRREGLDPDGNKISIDVTVFAEQEIAMGSVMWLGSLKDLPNTPTDLKQVVSWKRTPDVKGRNVHWELSLVRYNNTLPTAA